MSYKRCGNTYIVRIDKEEEIVETLQSFCEEQKIKLGSISGIGALDKAVISFFDALSKKFYSKELVGNYEIVSLLGNISTMNGKPYIHCHVTLGDSYFNTFSGHLNSAVVGTTCEVIVLQIEGEIERKFNGEIGLNLLEL